MIGRRGTDGAGEGGQRRSRQIQALRAVAVLSVVGFHIWPNVVRGGYVGVDVFFVISGYLITGHLARELDRTGTVRLSSFWARRIRRLLPAAFLVLVVSLVGTLLLVPQVQWGQELAEIRASALYFENWQLALSAADYLGAQNAPSIVQHYWSLSVEEQFYVVWPVLLLLVHRLTRRRRALLAVLCVILGVSLAYCVLLTAAGDPSAYFSTGTRGWEFSLGGLLALVPSARRPAGPRTRAVLGAVGFAIVVLVDGLYTRSTSFPGIAAVLPAIGAALVVRAGDADMPWSGHWIGRLGILDRLGAWSYSIYLWHWPLVIAVPLVTHRPLGLKAGLIVLALSIGIGALSKRFVEDPFRTSPRFARTALPAFAFMLVGALAISGGTVIIGHLQQQVVHRAAAQVARGLARQTQCVGANALANHCPRPFAETATVQPAVAANDVTWNLGVAASKPCHAYNWYDAPTPHACVFGTGKATDLTVALVGDSHADALIDALHVYALSHHWRLVTYTRASCSGIYPDPSATAPCNRWGRQVHDLLLHRSDVQVVLYTNYTRSHRFAASRAASEWASLRAAGKTVVPIRDVPDMPKGERDPTCVETHPHTYDPCAAAPPSRDRMQQAAARAGIPIVDLTDLFCTAGRCHAVIGGEIVYMDDDHLTLSYEYSLTDYLGARVAALIPKGTGPSKAGSVAAAAK